MPSNETHITVGRDGGVIRGADNAAIDLAIRALPREGGTVELLPGEYTCMDAVHMRSGVRLVGAGDKTVLRRAKGFRVPMDIDADYGQLKITPLDVSPFRVGQGLYVRDDKSGGWLDSVVTVSRIEGRAIHFEEPLVMDYSEENHGEVVASGALVSGVDVVDAAVEGLVVDGNKAENFVLDGCRVGGVYFHRSSRVSMSDVFVKDFAGDGISFQTTRDFRLERVRASGCANFGMHPGTGSTRVLMKDCAFSDNVGGGFFLCWRVQESRFENLVCERNGVFGVDIGHKDTDNVFVNCVFRGNSRAGVLFREENAKNSGHRNRFERCAIEDNGDAGVEVNGPVSDVLFDACTIRGTRGAAKGQKAGIILSAAALRFESRACTWSGHPGGNVNDLSRGAGGHRLDA